MCDMSATSVMYIGLNLTHPSDFQMLRGSVVVFTGIASFLFLGRKLKRHHFFGMLCVVVGTAIVGMATMVCKSKEDPAKNPAVGNLLVILAQIIVSVQMVVEEKFIGGYSIPALQVVGWEGLFGFLMLSCVVGIFYLIPQPTLFMAKHAVHPAKFEDAYDAFVMMGHNPAIIGWTVMSIFSIAFFNFFGISITKHLNAATRMVLDSTRTLIVWGASLALGWEPFCWVQVIGFLVLILGTVVYNELVYIPVIMDKPEAKDDVHMKLLGDDVEDNLNEPIDQLMTPSMQKVTAVHAR